MINVTINYIIINIQVLKELLPANEQAVAVPEADPLPMEGACFPPGALAL